MAKEALFFVGDPLLNPYLFGLVIIKRTKIKYIVVTGEFLYFGGFSITELNSRISG